MGSIMIRRCSAASLFVVMLSMATIASAADVPLIPRAVIFGNPDRINVKISPDGKRLAYLAPSNGVLNVWIASVDDLSNAKVVTRDNKKRGIREYYWSWRDDAIIYRQDEGGNENWNLFRVDLATGETKNLSPNPAVQAHVYAMSWRHPDSIVVGMNDRDAQLHDVHRMDLATGQTTLLMRNPGQINGDKVFSW